MRATLMPLLLLVVTRALGPTVLGYLLAGRSGLAAGMAASILVWLAWEWLWRRRAAGAAAYDTREEAALVQAVLVQAAPRRHLPPPSRVVISDRPRGQENAYTIAASPLPWTRPRYAVAIERDWIRLLPAPILAAVLGHELGHLTPRARRLSFARRLLPGAWRLVILGLAPAAPDALRLVVAILIVAGSLVVDGIEAALLRAIEYEADRDAASHGQAAALIEFFGWIDDRRGGSEPNRTLLSRHPLTYERIGRLQPLAAAEGNPPRFRLGAWRSGLTGEILPAPDRGAPPAIEPSPAGEAAA